MRRYINFLAKKWYLDNCPRGKLPPLHPRLGLGFGSRSGLVLGWGDNQTIAPEENCPPVRIRACLGVSFAVGVQFSSGAIVVEPKKLYSLKNLIKKSAERKCRNFHFISIVRLQNFISSISVRPIQKQPFADVLQSRCF